MHSVKEKVYVFEFEVLLKIFVLKFPEHQQFYIYVMSGWVCGSVPVWICTELEATPVVRFG